MSTLKQIVFASVLVGALLSTVAAQESTSATIPTSSVTITAAAAGDRVRITAPSSVVQMHVEVYAANGEKLFDQEIRGGNVFDWHLQDGQAQRLAPGSYVCVVTAKSISGRLTQKIGTVTVAENSAVVQPAEWKQLSMPQAQYIGPVEENSSWTIAGADEPQTPTVIAHDGADGQMIRGRGALTFRIGNFFNGIDTEQMRLTEDGNLGIGTSAPKSKLDVAGAIRAERFLVVKPKLTAGQTTDSNTLATDSSNVQPLVAGNGTAGKLTKWTDGSGTLGDSVVTESAGNIGIGTATPTQALDVLNGRIVTTGSQTLTATSDSMIEVKSTITNNGLAQSAIKARNLFNGPGDFVTGIDGAPTFAPSTSINTAQGFVAAAFFAPPPGVTITNALGGASATVYSNASGAVTNGTAFNIVSPFVFGALKPATQYGLHINNQGIAGTNTSFGLFVDAQAGSANNYSAIFAGGNVGIGTTTPGFKLDVVGRMRVKQATNSATNTAGIWFNQIGPGNDQAFVGMVDDTHVGFFGGTGGAWGLAMDTNNGNVGVGTTTPTGVESAGAKLQLVGDAGTDGNPSGGLAPDTLYVQGGTGGVGTVAGGFGSFVTINGGNGGDTTSDASGPGAHGGEGGGVRINGGTGGNGANANNFGGTGGQVFIRAGDGGNDNSVNGIGGNGGNLVLQAGQGGLGNQSNTRSQSGAVLIQLGALSGPLASGPVVIGSNVGSGAKLQVYGQVSLLTQGGTGHALCQDVNALTIVDCSGSRSKYKSQIQSFGVGLDVVQRLRPVSFLWKKTGEQDFGLVAEEVHEVAPRLNTYTAKGEVDGVRYDRLAVVLINAVQQQQTQIREQQKEIEKLKQIVSQRHAGSRARRRR